MQIRTLETVCSPEQFHHCHHHLLPSSTCLLKTRVGQSGQAVGPEALGGPSSLQLARKMRVETQAQAPGVTRLHVWGGTLSPPLATPPPGFLKWNRSQYQGWWKLHIPSSNRRERSIY